MREIVHIQAGQCGNRKFFFFGTLFENTLDPREEKNLASFPLLLYLLFLLYNSTHSTSKKNTQKSVPNSGKSSPTSTESIPREPTTETPTFSWRELTCTTTKPLEDVTFPELSLWILSPVRWIP